MMIQVVADETKTYSNLGNTYRFVEMICGTHHASVSICTGGSNPHVNVIVHNASNRAWNRLGKVFPTAEAAKANYKTAAIRAMIDHAAA